MICFFGNGLSLHIHVCMPAARFTYCLFICLTNLFARFICCATFTVSAHECGESANIICILLMQIPVVGKNRFCRIAAIIIFIFKALYLAVYRSAIIMKANIFSQ